MPDNKTQNNIIGIYNDKLSSLIRVYTIIIILIFGYFINLISIFLNNFNGIAIQLLFYQISNGFLLICCLIILIYVLAYKVEYRYIFV